MSEEEQPIASRSDAELKKIAVDLYHGKIFTDRHLPRHEQRLLGNIFMPLFFGGEKMLKAAQENEYDLIFEYLDKREIRSINGYPIFFSCQFLTRSERETMSRYYEQYKEMQAAFEAPQEDECHRQGSSDHEIQPEGDGHEDLA